MEKEAVSAIGRAVYGACICIDLLAHFTVADGQQLHQNTGHYKMCFDNFFLTCGNSSIGVWLVWR